MRTKGGKKWIGKKTPKECAASSNTVIASRGILINRVFYFTYRVTYRVGTYYSSSI